MSLNMPGRTPPTYLQISRYWESRCLLCDAPWSAERCVGEDHILGLLDAGEPECLRCGIFLGYTSHGSLPAERAHIIPRSRVENGLTADRKMSDVEDVSNYALLCPNCHKADPEFPRRRDWLTWCYAERVRRRQAIRTLDMTLCELGGAQPDFEAPAVQAAIFAALPDTFGPAERSEVLTRLRDL